MKILQSKIIEVVAITFMLLAPQLSHSAIITYTDSATWSALAGSVDTEDFNDVFLNAGLTTTLSANGDIDTTVAGHLYDDLLAGSRSTLFSFDTAITAFAGDIFDLEPGGVGAGIEVAVLFEGGGSDIITDIITANGFWGFVSDTAISEVSLLDFGGARERYAIDNLVYSAQAVPEPATLMLFGLGLLGVGFSKRFKKV